MDVYERDKRGKVGYRGREGVVFQYQEVCKFVRGGSGEIRKEGGFRQRGGERKREKEF